jgi:hypothetical protein
MLSNRAILDILENIARSKDYCGIHSDKFFHYINTEIVVEQQKMKSY